EAEDVDADRTTCAVSAERCVFRSASGERLAMESRARRYQVVAERASRISAPAFDARRRFLDSAQHAHAARRGSAVDRDDDAGCRRDARKRYRRTGAAQSALCVDRRTSLREWPRTATLRSTH